MFTRNFIIAAGALVLVTLLVGREWLIHEEIISTEDQLRSQLTEQIHAAATSENLRHLTSAATTFERFLEPVIADANRLAWPFARTQLILDWNRELHSQIDDLSQNRSQALQKQFKDEVSDLSKNSGPGLNRLYAILDHQKDLLGVSDTCKSTVQDEMKSMKESSSKKDSEVVAQMKTEGNAKLALLHRNVKKMSKKDLGEYLASGKFIHEVQQPVLDLMVQIRDSDLRASAWAQYRKKLDDVFSKKHLQLARAEKLQGDRLQKLFDPLAEAVTEDKTLGSSLMLGEQHPAASSNSVLVAPENPGENLPTPENPSSAEDPSQLME